MSNEYDDVQRLAIDRADRLVAALNERLVQTVHELEYDDVEELVKRLATYTIENQSIIASFLLTRLAVLEAVFCHTHPEWSLLFDYLDDHIG